MAQPARPSRAGSEIVSPDVACAVQTVMSRDHILHKVRTALGRSADQAPPPAPPARISIPAIVREAKIESFLDRLGALAGKAFPAATPGHSPHYVPPLSDAPPPSVSHSPFL